MQGRLGDADRLTFDGFALGTESDQPDVGVVFAAGAFLVRFDQGRLGEIIDVVEQTVHDNPGIPGLRASLAIVFCDVGRHEHACTLLTEECDTRFAGAPYDQFWVVTLVQWALVMGELRDTAAAELLFPLLEPWADQFAFTGAHLFGSVAHALALCESTLGRRDDADTRFAHALEVYESFGAPSWAARVRLAWPRARRRRSFGRQRARRGACARCALLLRSSWVSAASNAARRVVLGTD